MPPLHRYLSQYFSSTKVEALVTDRDDALYEFHVANNDGQSSSILDLKQHEKIRTLRVHFEAYGGCARLADIERLLTTRGYAEIVRRCFANRPGGSRYYDVVYGKSGKR